MASHHPIRIQFENQGHEFSLDRQLPIREVAPGVRVALFNILGDWEMAEAAGRALASKIPKEVEILLMPDGKAQALLHVLGRETGLPTVVARKERKPYMGGGLVSVEVQSITTRRIQSLFLSEEDAVRLSGKNVAFVDDVISSGGTLEALKALVEKINRVHEAATHVATLAVFTEGTPREDVISLGHLPLF